MDRRDHDPSSSKRDNTTPSCSVCQRRKVKCNRVYPCAPCLKGGRDCQYLPRAPRARPAAKASRMMVREAAHPEPPKRLPGLEKEADPSARHQHQPYDQSISASMKAYAKMNEPSETSPGTARSNMMPTNTISLSRHTAGYLGIRERIMIHGAKPHNASLVGMGDGEWPAFSTVSSAQPDDLFNSEVLAPVDANNLVLQPWTFGLATMQTALESSR